MKSFSNTLIYKNTGGFECNELPSYADDNNAMVNRGVAVNR